MFTTKGERRATPMPQVFYRVERVPGYPEDITVHVSDDPRTDDGHRIEETGRTCRKIASQLKSLLSVRFRPELIIDEIERGLHETYFIDACQELAEEQYSPEGYGWKSIDGDSPEEVIESLFYDHDYTIDGLKDLAAIAQAVADHFGWPFEYTAEEIYPREFVEEFIDLTNDDDFESNYQNLREAFGAEREEEVEADDDENSPII
jgi:hypothetical protein